MAIVVDTSTRLVVQGLTGSEGRFHGLRNRDYGTDLVAGVTPGKGGQDVEGVPVFDTVFMGDDVEEAERLRDPSHVRNYSEDEWRAFIRGAGLDVGALERIDHVFDLASWLARTGCEGADAARAVALLGDRAADGRLRLDKIVIDAVVQG